MNRIVLVLAVVLGVSIILFSFPKSVVQNQKISQTTTNSSDSKTSPSSSAVHGTATIAPKTQKKITQLLAQIQGTKDIRKWTKVRELIDEYKKIHLDSAAFWLDSLAQHTQTLPLWKEAGQGYFLAMQLASDKTKSERYSGLARTCFEKVLAKNPMDLETKTQLAMTFVGSSTPMNGIFMLREVLAVDPNYEPAVFNLGVLAVQSNQWSKAIERFRHVLRTNDKNTQAMFYLGISLAENKEKEEAKKWLLKVIELEKTGVLGQEAQNILQKL